MSSRRQFVIAGAAALAGVPAVAWLSRPARPDADDTPLAAGLAGARSEAEWRRTLTPAQYATLREERTEPPFTSTLNDEKRQGRFACAGCGQALFSSQTKFDSGTGWPSFWQALDAAVATRVDRSWLLVRTEVHCASCGGHLGHVFPDGPPPTGLRYCMNGVALRFEARV